MQALCEENGLLGKVKKLLEVLKQRNGTCVEKGRTLGRSQETQVFHYLPSPAEWKTGLWPVNPKSYVIKPQAVTQKKFGVAQVHPGNYG